MICVRGINRREVELVGGVWSKYNEWKRKYIEERMNGTTAYVKGREAK